MLAGIVLTLVSLWYGYHHNLLPIEATKEASLIDDLFNVMMVIGTGLFILVQGIIIIAVFRFRRQPGDQTDGPPIHGNIPLEILWTAIPTFIVLGIGVYSFNIYLLEGGRVDLSHPMAHSPEAHHQSTHLVSVQPVASSSVTLVSRNATQETLLAQHNRNQRLQQEALQDPATASVRNAEIPQRQEAPGAGVVSPGVGPTPQNQGQPPEFTVNVTGLQYAWLFTYPEQSVISGELHLPVGREVRLNISANDVIHAFWVPEFRLKQDAIPGRQTELRFTPNRVGEFGVICAELCGAYHSAMKTLVKVEPADEYERWLQSQSSVAAQSSATATVAALSEPASAHTLLDVHARKMGVNASTLHQLHSFQSPAEAL